MTTILRALASVVLATAFLFAPATAQSVSPPESRGFRGEYTLSYLGLTIVRIDLDSSMDRGAYSIQGKVSSAGLGAFFYDTKGTLAATGRVGERIEADSFRADYRYNDKPTLVDIRFSQGNVVKVVNEPPLRKRGKNWVPIEPDDLKSVLDPIAATLVKADRIEDVCKGGARMFDGELRADLGLSFVRSGKMTVKGFDGPTITCGLKFTPAAGYRKGRRALEYLSTRSRIMVTFAQIGQTGIYAPIHATIGTQIGTITVHARRFEALQAS